MPQPHHHDRDLAAMPGRAAPDGMASLPHAWDAIPTFHQPGKARITIRVDHDVVSFFRSMGVGWQSRANAVLRAFVLSGHGGFAEETAPTPVAPRAEDGGVQDPLSRCRRVRELLRVEGIEADPELVGRIVKAVEG